MLNSPSSAPPVPPAAPATLTPDFLLIPMPPTRPDPQPSRIITQMLALQRVAQLKGGGKAQPAAATAEAIGEVDVQVGVEAEAGAEVRAYGSKKDVWISSSSKL